MRFAGLCLWAWGLGLGKKYTKVKATEGKNYLMEVLSLDDYRVTLKVKKHCLQVETNRETLSFDPLKFPYKVVVMQSIGGFLSMEALEWLGKHGVTILKTGYGHQSVILPRDFGTHARLRLAQFRAYENLETRMKIARMILESKTGVSFADCKTISAMLTREARIECLKWLRLKEEIFDKTEFKFDTRASTRHKNFGANCEINALLNYSFAILETICRKAILAAGLEPTIGFLHIVSDTHEALVYDLQETYRIVCENVVCEILKELKPKDFYRSHVDYTFKFKENARKLLLSRLKEAFEERVEFEGQKVKIEGTIYFSAYNLANFLLGKKKELNLPVLR